jgi:hypothetical protein
MTFSEQNIAAEGQSRLAAEAILIAPSAAIPNDDAEHPELAQEAVAASSPKAAKGQSINADKAGCSVPDAAPHDDAGRDDHAHVAFDVAPASSPKAEAGQLSCAAKAEETSSASALIDQLAELQVRRKFYIAATNKQTNAIKALVRRGLGWRYDEEETDREKVNGRAARIVAAALGGKPQKPEDEAIYGALSADLAVVAAAIEPMTAARHQIELEMQRIVRKLPINAWAKQVRGLGEKGLAVILAEAGDLSGYPKKGHLWKRLGLAPYEGMAYSTWRMKGGLSAEDWTEAGYSPRRRAEIFSVIGDPLFRAQSVAQGPYRAVYDRRRALTGETHPDWTKAHSHADALRVMTKIMLRDLWREWNRAMADQPVGEAV